MHKDLELAFEKLIATLIAYKRCMGGKILCT